MTKVTRGRAPQKSALGTRAETQFQRYAQIIRAHGGQVNPQGMPTVLGLRGMTVKGTTHATTSSLRYDDTFVVLTADGRVHEFRGSTHPGYGRSPANNLQPQDANGDGVGDVGTLKPGNYMVVPRGKA